MDVTVTVLEYGDFAPIRTEDLPVTGRDGQGQKTPTVRELIDILKALPEQFQDLPVARYCEEGIWGINYQTSYNQGANRDSAHVQLW